MKSWQSSNEIVATRSRRKKRRKQVCWRPGERIYFSKDQFEIRRIDATTTDGDAQRINRLFLARLEKVYSAFATSVDDDDTAALAPWKGSDISLYVLINAEYNGVAAFFTQPPTNGVKSPSTAFSSLFVFPQYQMKHEYKELLIDLSFELCAMFHSAGVLANNTTQEDKKVCADVVLRRILYLVGTEGTHGGMNIHTLSCRIGVDPYLIIEVLQKNNLFAIDTHGKKFLSIVNFLDAKERPPLQDWSALFTNSSAK
eukprot:m.41971 g.41971  ORF g.41971 m.41971 type:complete len:256 (-) comp10478_c0_seq1:1415-2182(-)